MEVQREEPEEEVEQEEVVAEEAVEEEAAGVGVAAVPAQEEEEDEVTRLSRAPPGETLSDRCSRLASLCAVHKARAKEVAKKKKLSDRNKARVWSKMQTLSETDALAGVAMMRQRAEAKAQAKALGKAKARPKAKAKAAA